MKEEVTLSRVKITETSLRDGHQSLMATRLTTAEILPIVEKMDRAGYYALEVWGGATFDSAIRFLNEDPWERLREIRKRAKNTKLQMLLRGQNLLGYRHYADDIVDKFVEKSIKNGIDIIRTFDALNDVRNIRQALESTKKYGGHSQLAICYTISPVHTIEYYKNLALEMQNMGADSIAIQLRAEEIWDTYSGKNVSQNFTHAGQQLVNCGNGPVPCNLRSNSSFASSMMVKSAPKLVSTT